MYLLACTIALGLAIGWTTRRLLTSPATTSFMDLQLRIAKMSVTALLPSVLMAAPLYTTIYDSLLILNSRPVPVSSGRASLVIGLIGAALVMAMAVGEGIRRRKEASFMFVGWVTLSTISAAIVAIAIWSQLSFLSTPDSGMVSWSYFRDQVNDLECSSDIILVRWDSSADPSVPLTYRCPHGYVFNAFAAAPFIPWPDYDEGSSTQLANALHQTMTAAQRSEAEVR